MDPSETTKGQDSIFCEGQCSAWIHRQCAGLSKSIFDSLTKSKEPFYCPHCTLQNHTSEIAKLKQVIESLTESITQLKVASAKPITLQGNSNNQTLPQATVSQPPTESQERSEPRKRIIPDSML